uniref:Peptidase A1 domain-containing protein n=1 Tax=Psilocybe cubensis TaxID=181762 RepID=A0A8H8CQ32_PSICU
MLKTIFFIALLVVELAGNPILVERSPINLPISRRANITGGLDLLKRDRARVGYIKTQAVSRGPADLRSVRDFFDFIDYDGVGYVAKYDGSLIPLIDSLIVDTGRYTAVLFFAMTTYISQKFKHMDWSRPTIRENLYQSQDYVPGGRYLIYRLCSKKNTGKNNVINPYPQELNYGSGSIFGDEYIDNLFLTPSHVVARQSIGVVNKAKGFEGVDGILGIGPVNLTLGTLSDNSIRVPTVTDNLFSQGTISSNEIGITFQPTTATDEHGAKGVITWGRPDSHWFTGNISYISLTNKFPSSEFWGFDHSIRYGSSTTILSSGTGVVDTGATFILLARDAFNRYQAATNSQPDSNTGLLKLPASSYNSLESLFFSAGEHTFEFTSNAQIWPRSLNADIGGVAGSIYLIVADAGTPYPYGDVAYGYVFLQRFYCVYDTANRRLGLAETEFTRDTSN